MNDNKFLIYSAKEPMKLLRKKFNQGESLYNAVPDSVSCEEALEDISYVRFVMEHAYSGYTYYERSFFDNAFVAMEQTIKRHSVPLTVNHLIDLIADHLSFLCDGHLSLTTEDYGRGFYQKLQTYVADIMLTEMDGQYVDTVTKETVEIVDNSRLFPTISENGVQVFLVGKRSKKPVDEIELTVGGISKKLPVHKIKSKEPTAEILISENYDRTIAYITCSSFVGDNEDKLNEFYEIGKKCRNYQHVVWDLSNNLGGNSDFPKQFLLGLNGGCTDTSKVFELQSTLVHAKEHGEITDISYCLKNIPSVGVTGTALFNGKLHVIINDMVASSAESAIIMAASMQNVTFYGCNSLGIGRFGDLCIYYLPNSQATLWCPQKVFDNSIEETVGFEPDIWIDSSDVTSLVTKNIQID